jgi:hypothetical protein
LRIGLLIDHHLHGAVAFVDSGGPNGHGDGAKTVKLHVAKMACSIWNPATHVWEVR